MNAAFRRRSSAWHLPVMACALLWCAATTDAQAGTVAEHCPAAGDDCVAVGHWNFSVTLGAGLRSNPLAKAQTIPLLVLPEISYYGERVFLHNLDVGVTLAHTPTHTFSLVASPSYDRVYFYRSDLQNFLVTGLSAPSGIAPPPACPCTLLSTESRLVGGSPNAVQNPPRRPRVMYLAGPEWTFAVGRNSGQLSVLHDITGRSDGTEIRAAMALPLRSHTTTSTLHVGLTWKSASLVNYYYGVPALYAPGAALNPFLKLSIVRPLKERWTLRAFLDGERLANSIANSPIVSKRYVASAFVGASYDF